MSRRQERRPRTVILLGVSGSGKDTQAKFLRRALPRARIISTGDSFRAIARRKSLVGRYIGGIMQRGGLVPYWAAAYVWLNKFCSELGGDESVIFTGAPRRIEEARMLDDVMRDLGRALPEAIYLELTEREAKRRLLNRGRYDDTPRAIVGRVRFFREHVRPVIRYYRGRGRLITINGDQRVPAVWRDIRKALRLR